MRLRGKIWEWESRVARKLGDPIVVQAGFLRTAGTTALNCHSEAAIGLDHCFAKGDQSRRGATDWIAKSRSIGIGIKSWKSSAGCREDL